MTADIIQMKEPRGPRLRRAMEEYCRAGDLWVEKTLELAIEMAAARAECGGDDRAFGIWLAENDCAMSWDDSAAWVGVGTHLVLARQVLQETTRRSIRYIWTEEIKPLISRYVARDVPVATSNAKPLVPVDLNAQVAKMLSLDAEKPDGEHGRKAGGRDSKPSASRKTKLQLYLADESAEILQSQFKQSRIFSSMIGDKNDDKRRALLRYLAKRCVQADYPIELFSQSTWTVQLLYPHLPLKLLDMAAPSFKKLYGNHGLLVKTEEQFVLTPEFGVTDPPLVAFNKANAIYHALVHVKNGGTIDQSAIHRPAYAGDEGKPPVIVLGTQLWPPEEGAGYGYDDLRCAFEFAKDILLTFGEPREAPMSSKSLKLRHLMSWLPGGYNSTGSTTEGLLKALKDVVQAYSANKSEVMRNPLPSMKKLDE